jgi:hypothetical protein
LPVQLAVMGLCWPVAVALVLDLLVLRTSMIPPVAAPYGQRPTPTPRSSDRVKLVDDLRRVDRLAGEIKEVLSHLEATSAAVPQPVRQAATAAPGLPRRVSIELSVSSATSLNARRPAPEAPTQGEYPPNRRTPPD